MVRASSSPCVWSLSVDIYGVHIIQSTLCHCRGICNTFISGLFFFPTVHLQRAETLCSNQRCWQKLSQLQTLVCDHWQLVKYVPKHICITHKGFPGLSCTGSWCCLVWPNVREPLQAAGVKRRLAGPWWPSRGAPCRCWDTFPPILGFVLSSCVNSRVTGWPPWAIRPHVWCCSIISVSWELAVLFIFLLNVIPMCWDGQCGMLDCFCWEVWKQLF